VREEIGRVREAIGHDRPDRNPSPGGAAAALRYPREGVTPTLRALLCGLAMALAAAALPAPGLAGAQGAEPAPVRVVELEGSIDRVAAAFAGRQLDAAEDAGAAAVVIRLDAPGGLGSAAGDVVADMQAAEVAVTVWVGPSGARADGAGADVAAAADELGMAPGAEVGPAATADTVQPTLEGFVAWLDGRPGPSGPIETAGAPVETSALPWYLRALQALADPDLVFLLLLLGLAGVGFELLHPGGIVPALVGGISLLLGIAGLAALPFQGTGVALIALAAALFFAETQAAGRGALAAGGIVCFILGGAFLFDDEPGLAPSLGLTVATATVVGGAFAVAAHLAQRERRRPSRTGGGALVGEEGRARGAIGPRGGSVLVNGEIWAARAAAGTAIPAGQRVRVVTVQVDDLTLTVEPREG
jgi:membrane-bound serine protease (ClpP class)